jgi:hypothetical protein
VKDPRIETTTGFDRGLMILGRGRGIFRGLPHMDDPDQHAVVWHITSRDIAEKIMREGFSPITEEFVLEDDGKSRKKPGVWFSMFAPSAAGLLRSVQRMLSFQSKEAVRDWFRSKGATEKQIEPVVQDFEKLAAKRPGRNTPAGLYLEMIGQLHPSVGEELDIPWEEFLWKRPAGNILDHGGQAVAVESVWVSSSRQISKVKDARLSMKEQYQQDGIAPIEAGEFVTEPELSKIRPQWIVENPKDILQRSHLGELPRVGEGDLPAELAVKQVGLAGAVAAGHGIPHLSGDLHPAAQELKENWPRTYDIQEAALILRDGTRIAFGQNSSHEDILEDAVSKETLEALKGPGYPDLGLLYITYFLHETGSVRVVHGGGKIFFEAAAAPSTAQIDVMLDAHAEGHTGKVFEIEFDRGAGDFVMYQEEFPTSRGIRAFFQKRQGGHWTPHIFGGLSELWQGETFDEIYEYLVSAAGDWTVTGQGPDGWDLWTMDVPLEDGRKVRVTGQYDGDQGTNTGEMVIEELELIEPSADLGQLEFFQHPVVLPEKEEVKLVRPTEEERMAHSLELREAIEKIKEQQEDVPKEFNPFELPEGEWDGDEKEITEEIEEILEEVSKHFTYWLDYMGKFPGDLIITDIDAPDMQDILESVRIHDGEGDIDPDNVTKVDWFLKKANLRIVIKVKLPVEIYPDGSTTFMFAPLHGRISELNWFIDRFRRPSRKMRPDIHWPKSMAFTFFGAWQAFAHSMGMALSKSIYPGPLEEAVEEKDARVTYITNLRGLKAFHGQFRVEGTAWELAALATPDEYFAARKIADEPFNLRELRGVDEMVGIDAGSATELHFGDPSKERPVYLEWNYGSPLVIAPLFWVDETMAKATLVNELKEDLEAGDERSTADFFEHPEKYAVTLEIGHWPSGMMAKLRSYSIEYLPGGLEEATCVLGKLLMQGEVGGRLWKIWRDVTAKRDELISKESFLSDTDYSEAINHALGYDDVWMQELSMFESAISSIYRLCKIGMDHDIWTEEGMPTVLGQPYREEGGFWPGGGWAAGKEEVLRSKPEHVEDEDEDYDEGDDLEGLGGSIEDELQRIGEYAATEVIVQRLGEGRAEIRSRDHRFLYRSDESNIRKGLQRIEKPPPPASEWDEGMIRSFWFVVAHRRFSLNAKAWYWAHLAPPEFFGAQGRLGKKRREGWVLADGEWGITSSTGNPEKPDMIFHFFTGMERQVEIPFAILDRDKALTADEQKQLMRCVVLEIYKVVRGGLVQSGELTRTLQLGLAKKLGVEPKKEALELLKEMVYRCWSNKGVLEGSRRAVTFEGLHGMPRCLTCGKRP